MAEESKNQENGTKKHRKLRVNTETIREQSAKHQLKAATPEKPKRSRAFVSGFFAPLRAVGRFIGKLERFRVFRILGRILFPRYFRNSWRELRLVAWPDRRTTWKLTYAVIVFSVIFGLIVAGVDFVLDKLFKELIIK